MSRKKALLQALRHFAKSFLLRHLEKIAIIVISGSVGVWEVGSAEASAREREVETWRPDAERESVVIFFEWKGRCQGQCIDGRHSNESAHPPVTGERSNARAGRLSALQQVLRCRL